MDAIEIDRLMREGRARWPAIALDRPLVEAALASVTATDVEHPDDLYLAIGCAAGNEAALHVFDRELLPQVGPVIRRLSRSPAFVGDVLQEVRIRLLLPPDQRIKSYEGRGPLVGWLRVTAARVALNARARHIREMDTSSVSRLVAHDVDIGVQLLRHRHGAVFRASFATALRQLDDSERKLLTMKLAGVSRSDIASTLAVDATTISRRLSRVCGKVLTLTRKDIAAQLKLDAGEISSVVRALAGTLDARVLRHEVDGGD